MSKHIIKKSDIEGYETSSMLAGSFGGGENKLLTMHCIPFTKKIWFTVVERDKDNKTTEYEELADAVKYYNFI